MTPGSIAQKCLTRAQSRRLPRDLDALERDLSGLQSFISMALAVSGTEVAPGAYQDSDGWHPFTRELRLHLRVLSYQGVLLSRKAAAARRKADAK